MEQILSEPGATPREPVGPPAKRVRAGKGQRSKRDLRPSALRSSNLRDDSTADSRLYAIFEAVEQQYIAAIEWYINDKRKKRRYSQVIRIFALLAAAFGVIAPIMATVTPLPSQWGYIALGVAASAIGFDRYLGLSSGWMRDMRVCQALDFQFLAMQHDWLRWSMRYVDASDKDTDSPDIAGILHEYSERCQLLVSLETNEWITEFEGRVLQLQAHLEDLPRIGSRKTGESKPESP